MPYTCNGPARLFWDERGAGTAVLLAMGASYSSRMWYPVIDALSERHRVIFFDNRGIGRSAPVTAGSIQDMAADAVAVLDAAGVGKAHVYGASLGGVVVLQMALQSPERVTSLILGCTGILSAEKPRPPRVMNVLARLPASVRRRLLGAASDTSYGSAASPEAVEADLAVLAEEQSGTGLLQQQKALRAYSVERSAVSGVTAPALVLHGTEDSVVPLSYGQELHEALPNSRFISLPGAGHNYLVAYRQRANDEVLRFLKSVDHSVAGVAPCSSR